VVTSVESSSSVEVLDQIAPPPALRGWYAAVDRVRAYWMVRGPRAELVAAGILLVLAVAVFGLNAVLL
jgi:hypothetical protein